MRADDLCAGRLKSGRKIHGKTILSFILVLALCALLICVSLVNRMDVERLQMEQLIVEKSAKANESLSRLLYKTEILAAFVLKNNGSLDSFEQIAAMMTDDPAILNIIAAPGGIVTNIYPLKGNEAMLGFDYFGESAGNKEAIAAKDTGKFVFAGPFEAIQGGRILVGRLPVFIGENNDFWGIVSVTLKYPQALDGAGLNELYFQGFAYEIWRINPDDGKKQIVTKSENNYYEGARYIEKHIKIQDADWYFRILPVKEWYEYPDTWILIALGLVFSFLIAYVMQSNSDLKILKAGFEDLSNTDSLTGIHNRRYFLETAEIEVERAKRSGVSVHLIIFDIDHFKKINDLHGHGAGDEVLKSVVFRVRDILRPYDLFARYGGEEFIILAAGIDRKNAFKLAERVRLNICEKPIGCGNAHIEVTASFGVAYVSCDIDKAITDADKALYMAKNSGRNQTVLYEED